MDEPNYTPEQIETAWQTADEVIEHDPNDVRAVSCDGTNAFIKRSELNGSKRHAWEIDNEGQARGKGYKKRAAINAYRKQ